MSDRVALTFDDREFQKALRQYVDETQKEMAQVVNDKARFICVQASREMASANLIGTRVRELDNGLFNAIATGKTKSGVTKFGAKVKGQGNQEVAMQILLSRVNAKGYSAFLWKRMAAQLGGRMSKRASSLDHANATKAKRGIRPMATLLIEGLKKDHVTKIMAPALQKAVDKEAASMREYLAKRQAKIAAKRSSRR